MLKENPKDKELTKRRFIAAVGEIMKRDGYHGLGVNKIAKQAGFSKKLIYRYFGSVDFLIETYVVENDYWINFSKQLSALMEAHASADVCAFVTSILKNQFRYFLAEEEMQMLILWEISSKSSMMKSIHKARESTGQSLFEMTDPHFKDRKVNFRAIAALLVGGIYYTILHMRFNGGSFCDLDISKAEGQKELVTAIEQIVGWAFENA